MCDCYAGSVLLSFRRDDEFAFRAMEGAFARQTAIISLDEAAGRDLGELGLDHVYLQVTVPAGNEQTSTEDFRRNYIGALLDSNASQATMRRWLVDPDFAPIAQPEAVATASGHPVSGAAGGLAFTAEHTRYRQLLSFPAGAQHFSLFAPTVGVLDSGWQPIPSGPAVLSERDLTTSPVAASASDSYGHGTVVLAIIDDLAPDSQFRIYRVGDKDTREWAFLAGLASAAADGCDIVNASIGFGLADRSCSACGRDYGTTRSAVFHRLLGNLLDNDPDLVFVGSAGNQSASRATYPARFTPTVCVASTDGAGSLSTFSNWGSYDQDDQPHPCLVLAPGGDRSQPAGGSDEYVASYNGADWRGTSFATAYVTGLLADHLTQVGSRARSSVLMALTGAASPGMVTGYVQADHGAGLAQRL